MERVLVTGASGFLGNKMVLELIAHGYEVIAAVRNAEKKHHFPDNPKLEVIECDLDSDSDLERLLETGTIDTVYHFAWAGTSGTARKDAFLQLENVEKTLNLIETVKKMGCCRFIFAASIMEYEISELIDTEITTSENAFYSVAKLTADYMARIKAEALGIEYIRAIISNVYGPGEKSARLINTTIRKLLAGEHCSFSPGEQMYDFVYIDDAVGQFIALGERGIPYKSYYIGSSAPQKLKVFLTELGEVVAPGVELGIGELPFDGISLDYGRFDISGIEQDTGFIQAVSFKDGINRTKDWIIENEGIK